jgi:hypothetical protein
MWDLTSIIIVLILIFTIVHEIVALLQYEKHELHNAKVSPEKHRKKTWRRIKCLG